MIACFIYDANIDHFALLASFAARDAIVSDFHTKAKENEMLRPQQNESRECQVLDGFWEFQMAEGDGRELNLPKGLTSPRPIGVPGSWNEQYLDSYNHFSEGWYQKRFFVNRSWQGRPIFAHFQSVCQSAEVWLNGEHLGSHEGPHLPFEFEITDRVKFGQENILVVLADGTLKADALPPAYVSESDLRQGWSGSYPSVSYDFFPFSGIHRPVILHSLSTGIYLNDVFVQATHQDETATVTCQIEFNEAVTGMVSLAVDGREILAEVRDASVLQTSFTIDHPRLWDIGQGNLYTLKVALAIAGETVDHYRVRFGVRNIEVRGNEFLLNGKPVTFKGFGRHEDFDVIGKGLCHPLIIKDFDLMKWIGANSFRTSHYPYAEEWLDIADEQGVLVISETPFVGLGPRLYRQEILDKALPVVGDLVRRDRNHPSVVMWSLANEPNAFSEDPAEQAGYVRFYEELLKRAKSLDTSRPFTYAMHATPANNPMARLFDVLCINKYFGWYCWTGKVEESLGAMVEDLQAFYDEFQKPIIMAEFGADAIAGEHHLPEVMFSEEYQSKTVELQYGKLMEQPWCIGAHVWNFADFRVGQSLNRVIFNRKGVFTRSRQPKMVAHTLKRIWRD
jgi:beta-glucuronidase